MAASGSGVGTFRAGETAAATSRSIQSGSSSSVDPKNSERTIYVSDDGLLDSAADDMDALTAEFRHRLGLLPEEEQVLSEAFKARVGVIEVDIRNSNVQLVEEIDNSSGGARDETLRRYKFSKFATTHFQAGSPKQYTKEPLRQPLLPKTSDVTTQASLAVWQAIQLLVAGAPQRKVSTPNKIPVPPTMAIVSELLEWTPDKSSRRRNSSVIDSQHDADEHSGKAANRTSWKKLFRPSINPKKSVKRSSAIEVQRSNSVTGAVDGNALQAEYVKSIPTTELDLIHFIISHGIMKSELRDEIYCQLCCVVTNNPSVEATERGWILHALCAGCFVPSSELLSYYYAFLHDVPSDNVRKLDFAKYTKVMLRRTNENGMRFHPPNWIELQAIKNRQYIVLDVVLPDGRKIPVESNPATTAEEICQTVAATIELRDTFGFAIYVAVKDRITSLGSGVDHVMDAITECEQIARSEGRLEETTGWRLFFQKEMFTPWHDPSIDNVATKLIFKQIVKSVRNDEFYISPDELSAYVAKCMHVENNTQLNLSLIKAKMADYLPKSVLATTKSREAIAQSILVAITGLGYQEKSISADQVCQQIVRNAAAVWPMHFSAMFEAYMFSGPILPTNNVVLSINSTGIFVLDGKYSVLMGFHYYDIIDAAFNNSDDVANCGVMFTGIDGSQFVFLSPNSETIAKLINAFLEGLQRRSRWAIATDTFILKDHTKDINAKFALRQGDVVELLDESQSPLIFHDWLFGRCMRTNESGSFPSDCVYVLPTSEKPSQEFMAMLGSLAETDSETLPRKRRTAVVISNGTIGRHPGHGVISDA